MWDSGKSGYNTLLHDIPVILVIDLYVASLNPTSCDVVMSKLTQFIFTSLAHHSFLAEVALYRRAIYLSNPVYKCPEIRPKIPEIRREIPGI